MTDALAAVAELAPGIAGRAAGYDDRAEFPSQDLAELRHAGLLGLMVPERLGGLGAGFEDYVAVAMALAGASPATALVFNMHASVTGALATVPEDLARALGATDRFFEVRDRVLAAATGSLHAVAISEAGVGSRLSRLVTSYQPLDDGYRIVGAKVPCSAAGHAEVYMVAARSLDEPDEAKVSYFLIPAGDGVEVTGDWDPLGMRATASRGLTLDVTVGTDALVGVEGVAVLLAYAMPQWLVASYAAVYAGLARAAVDEATRWLEQRYGARSVPHAARLRLGRCDAQAAAAQAAVEAAARRVDRSPGDPETNRWLYRAKLVAGDAAMAVAASLAEACGLSALARGSAMERLYRDARLGAVMPPRSDVCADYLGADALGLDPMTDLVEPPW